jgi:hypothetical protein
MVGPASGKIWPPGAGLESKKQYGKPFGRDLLALCQIWWLPTQKGEASKIKNRWKADGKDRVTLPVGLGVNWMTKIFGRLPVHLGLEGYYAVIHPEDAIGSRWSMRLMFTPVIPIFLF